MAHLCEMIISPGVVSIVFKILIFWVAMDVKEKKLVQNERKLDISGAIHHVIVFYGTHV